MTETSPPPASSPHRFVTREGQVNVKRFGLSQHQPRDWYHWLLTLSWPRLFLWLGLVYLSVCALFGCLYWLDQGGVMNLPPRDFLQAFFFSVETLTTMGYGHMYPQSTFSHSVMTIEGLIGWLNYSLVTGLFFTRLSRPSARVMFSHYAVIAPYEGVPTLIFRAANRRGNQLLQADMHVTLARNDYTREGEPLRRLYDLKLVRSFSPFFNLTWTVRHMIDETSPLYGETPDSMRTSESELIVLLTGVDDVFHQTVHGRFAYNSDEILHGYRFINMFGRDERNRPIIDYRHFDEVEPVSQPGS